MKRIDVIAVVLSIVGAVNWGLVGLFEFDLVARITGSTIGEANTAAVVVYALVGLAGLWTVVNVLPRVIADAGTETTRS